MINETHLEIIRLLSKQSVRYGAFYYAFRGRTLPDLSTILGQLQKVGLILLHQTPDKGYWYALTYSPEETEKLLLLL